MNLGYTFSKEVEPELLKFLKVAKQQKSLGKNCDLEKYEVWNQLLPTHPDLLRKLKEYEAIDAPPIIDLCSDEEPSQPVKEDEEETDTNVADTFGISDIAFVIKENLQTQNDLSEEVKEQLCKCEEKDLKMLFPTLEETLSSEEVYFFGIAMQNVMSSLFGSSFSHYLLVPRIKKKYCEKVFKLLEHFCESHSSGLLVECSLALQELTLEETSTMLEYLKKLNTKFQAALIRCFILDISKLDDNYLNIIGTLLNNDVEYEPLSKFVEMLSNVADDHNQDKNFGKLLMNVVEALGPNLIHVEQPLKHIIAGHKSVWKAKLEKTFSTCYEDSLFFSQSFRD